MAKSATRPTITHVDIDGNPGGGPSDLLGRPSGVRIEIETRRTPAPAPARGHVAGAQTSMSPAAMVSPGDPSARACACPSREGVLDDGDRHLRWWWPRYG